MLMCAALRAHQPDENPAEPNKKRAEQLDEQVSEANILKMPRKVEFSPEINKLCDEFLEQSLSFATKFAELAGVPEEKVHSLESMIVARCSEAITKARVAL